MFLSQFYSSSFTHPATTDIYTLSLHDALPIFRSGIQAHLNPVDRSSTRQREAVIVVAVLILVCACAIGAAASTAVGVHGDRKSTRLNSSHSQISYAVFCLKKKIKSSHMLRCCV